VKNTQSLLLKKKLPIDAKKVKQQIAAIKEILGVSACIKIFMRITTEMTIAVISNCIRSFLLSSFLLVFPIILSRYLIFKLMFGFAQIRKSNQ
jgi:hypothetical protein